MSGPALWWQIARGVHAAGYPQCRGSVCVDPRASAFVCTMPACPFTTTVWELERA